MAIKPTKNSAMEIIPNTVSMDLPPSIQELISMPVSDLDTQPVQYGQGGMISPMASMQTPANNGLQAQIPAGMQAPASAGLRTQMPQQQLNPQMIDMQVNNTLTKNPEIIARIRAGIEAGIQSGEITQQEIQMATQLAQVALQNPQMYPQLRQFAIDRGLANPDDLPEQYDQGLVIALVAVAKAMTADVQIESAGGQPMSMQPPPTQEMGFGGMVHGPSHNAGGVGAKIKGGKDIEVEGGEYIIPKHIVARKGTEFFDKLLGKDSKK